MKFMLPFERECFFSKVEVRKNSRISDLLLDIFVYVLFTFSYFSLRKGTQHLVKFDTDFICDFSMLESRFGRLSTSIYLPWGRNAIEIYELRCFFSQRQFFAYFHRKQNLDFRPNVASFC